MRTCCGKTGTTQSIPSSINSTILITAHTSVGTNALLKTFRQGPIKRIPLLVPPEDEQRQIVAEIEKQFTRLEAGVAALRRVQANLKRYRAAVLKAACEGRLVPTEAELAKAGNRKFETGEALLARILTERRQNWQGRGKYKEPAAPDTRSSPHCRKAGRGRTLTLWLNIKGGIRDQNRSTTVRHAQFLTCALANIQRGYIDLTEVK